MADYLEKFMNLVEEANENRNFETIQWTRVLHDIIQETFGLGYERAWDFTWYMIEFGAVSFDEKQIKVNKEQFQKVIWVRLKS